MQISSYRLWIFVEGDIDVPFYDRVRRALTGPLSCHNWIVVRSKELPGASAGGGKTTLLGFFRDLRRLNALRSELAGKRTLGLFFLDKDVDDVMGSRKRNSHVVYTEHYSVENYLFLHGDVTEAISVSARIDRTSVAAHVNDGTSWCRRAAENWAEWVAICLLMHKCRAVSGPNYGAPRSLIHSGPYGTVEQTKAAVILASAQAHSGLGASVFASRHRAMSATVIRAYSRGRADRIFNGKWYLEFALEVARKAAGGRSMPSGALKDLILGCLLLTVDYSAAWVERYHRAIQSASSYL
jgi:hypothetical protein